MNKHQEYQQRLSKIERDLKRTGDLDKAISRISWSAGLPIWWLEEFAPTWAQQAEARVIGQQDSIVKQRIRSSSPRLRTSGSISCFRFDMPRAEIRDEDDFFG